MRNKKQASSIKTVRKRSRLRASNSNKYEASRMVGIAISMLETNEIKQFTQYIPFEVRKKSNPHLKRISASK